MANFNPQINPTNDPTYTSVTRPIAIPDSITPKGVDTNQIMPQGQQIGDKSAEYLGKAAAYGSEAQGTADKGFTDLFAGIVGIGDFLGKAGVQMVRKDIEDKVYQVADSERQLYTQRLEELRNSGNVKNIIGGEGTDSEGKTLPSELTNLPDQLNVLQSAKDGGKISSTDYEGRLLAAAKSLRAKYPGFRQEIDQEFAKVTGHNPANAYVTKLIGDINRQGAAQSSEVNKLSTYITNNPAFFKDPVDALRKVQSGEWGRADIIRQAAPHEQLKLDVQERKAVFDDQNLSREERVRAGKELLNRGIDGVVSTFVGQFLNRMGMSNPVDAQTFADRTKTGEIGAKEWSAIGQQFATAKVQLREAIQNDARRQGLTKVLDQDEINKITDAAMKRLDAIGERIYNHDSGGVFSVAQQIKTMGDDDQKRLLENSKVGPDFRSIEVIKRIGGEQYLQDANLKQLTEGLSGRFQNYQKSWKDAIRAQVNMQTSGVPITLNDMFDEFKDKMKTATDSEKRKMNADMINTITEIASPKTPDAIKLNLAATAFTPGNAGFISRLNIDSVDAKGNPIQGQNAVFQKLTSPEMTKEMYRLGKSNQQIWNDYVNWTQNTLSNELIHRDVVDLGQIRNPVIRVGWDSDNKRLVPSYNVNVQTAGKLGVPVHGVNDPEYIHVQKIVNRINSNLSNYKNVAEAAGLNVDTFLLKTLADTAGAQSVQRLDNIPGDIMRQIGLTRLNRAAP